MPAKTIKNHMPDLKFWKNASNYSDQPVTVHVRKEFHEDIETTELCNLKFSKALGAMT